MTVTQLRPTTATFTIGSTTVMIVNCSIEQPPMPVEAIVSSDDNHLTMAGGVALQLAQMAGADYIRAAQEHAPVRAGEVVITALADDTQPFMPGLRYVLHAAVIDYDTDDLTLEETVYRVTEQALDEISELRCASALLPAFATGSGGLSMRACAREMCSAIREYLTLERVVETILIMLYDDSGADKYGDTDQRNADFVQEALLILGVPYHPQNVKSQPNELYGRHEAFARTISVLTGGVPSKRHVLVRGGPRLGGSALLDYLGVYAHQPEQPLRAGWEVARVALGAVHIRTPASFLYRKLLLCLGERERDPSMLRAIREAYSNVALTCDDLIAFLDRYGVRYARTLFLINDLPRLLPMATDEFWRDLDRLGARVQFAFSARDDEQLPQLLGTLSSAFAQSVETIQLTCLTLAQREAWLLDVYDRFLQRAPLDIERDFFVQEAGAHPYLLSLTASTVIAALQRDRLTNPQESVQPAATIGPLLLTVRPALVAPRRAFFEVLLGPTLDSDNRDLLHLFAEMYAARTQQAGNEPDGTLRLKYRSLRNQLEPLWAHGYITDTDPRQAEFMAPSFAEWAMDWFRVRGAEGEEQHVDLSIVLLRPESGMITTLVRGSGATSVVASSKLDPDVRARGLAYFGQLLTYLLKRERGEALDAPGMLGDLGAITTLADAANLIRTHFTTSDIKKMLTARPAPGSTVLLEIDDALKEIPWELMFDTDYNGALPFSVGRVVIGKSPPDKVGDRIRAADKANALLIADPLGDLPEAQAEVDGLRALLASSDLFAAPVVLRGPEQCTMAQIAGHLSSGKYSLIHYAGHTRRAGDQSAWYLSDVLYTTNLLTQALQFGPPALVVSSSCESGMASAAQPIVYENQTFDLPSAFLRAGVEAYIGTLWDVDSQRAQWFVAELYRELLSRAYPLGECLRRAKIAYKHGRYDDITWPAFILYGEPHRTINDLLGIADD